MRLNGINHVSIIGTGMIGASMAALFTGNGYKVTMMALNDQEAERGLSSYHNFYNDLVEKKLLTRKQAEKCATFLSTTQDYKDIAKTDFIFECVLERIEVKHAVYKQIEETCTQFKAIASSTSAISTDDLAKGFSLHKDKIVVAHPFYPPHLIPFVEIVKGKDTSDQAAKTVYDILESTGRKAVIAQKGMPGFVANRLQHALVREAAYMVEMGVVEPADIDKALMYSFMPRYSSVGLFQHQDAAGLDLVKNIEDYLLPSLSNETKTPAYIQRLVEKGDLGMKTGKGIYQWTEESKKEFHTKAAAPYLKFFNWDIPD